MDNRKKLEELIEHIKKVNNPHDINELKKINATGKSSTNVINAPNPMSFSGVDPNSAREGRKYCRSGGCVAPKKKGAY